MIISRQADIFCWEYEVDLGSRDLEKHSQVIRDFKLRLGNGATVNYPYSVALTNKCVIDQFLKLNSTKMDE